MIHNMPSVAERNAKIAEAIALLSQATTMLRVACHNTEAMDHFANYVAPAMYEVIPEAAKLIELVNASEPRPSRLFEGDAVELPDLSGIFPAEEDGYEFTGYDANGLACFSDDPDATPCL